MPFAGRPSKQGSGDSDILSSNLWVGNLPSDLTESDLTPIFAEYGPIEDLTSYSSRNYAFVFYKNVDDAKAARAALQGFVINGNPIKIEFAKPAKPSKNLWVGGISSSLTKEELEEEFRRFGKIKELKFLKDRSTALVEYVRLEDASAALKNLSGKQLGGENLRIDYLRSQPARREQFDFHDQRDQQFRRMGGPEQPWNSRDSMRFHPDHIHSGQNRQKPSQPLIGQNDGQPSRVLWVGYPPTVIVDEKMLYNAMILFGEIERIKSFPSRHCSFVEFRSVEEARNAKENLQGRLFNDSRITIMFSGSDMAPKEFLAPYPGFPGPRPDVFVNDVLGPINFSGGPPPNGAFGPFGPRGGFNALLPTPELNDSSITHDARDFGSPVGSSRRRMPSPTAGLLPLPVSSRPPNKASGWDVRDPNQIPREFKRARTDSGASFNDSPFAARGGDFAAGVGPYPHHEGNQLYKARGGDRFSPADVTVPKGPIKVYTSKDYIWRGIIAKGGSTVCRARCIPVGKEIGFHLPEVVDCSARTGLDMLAKHYADAVGFDIVFFLPECEEDFASYTEFLRYLGSKGRAGVARFDDGTTMFLVPPSDFLTEVLHVVGPERLYGVVLKLAHQDSPDLPSDRNVNRSISSMHHMDQVPAPPPYNLTISNHKDQVPHMDHNKVAYQGSVLHANTQFPPSSESPMPQAASHDPTSNCSVSASGAGVTLTPELIATLASLIPASAQVSGQNPQMPAISSSNVSYPSLGFDQAASTQSWNQQRQVPDPMLQSSQQFGNQMNTQTQPVSSFQTYTPVPSIPENSPFQNPTYSITPHSYPQPGAVTSMPLGMFPDASQSHQYASTVHMNPSFQQGVPYNPPQVGYGTGNGVVASTASYGLAAGETSSNSIAFTNQIQRHNYPQPENVMTGASSASSNPVNKIEDHQPVPAADGQSSADGEVDKNQRYQSTLQFAANLLLQIQQKQQANAQVGQGLGNQQ